MESVERFCMSNVAAVCIARCTHVQRKDYLNVIVAFGTAKLSWALAGADCIAHFPRVNPNSCFGSKLRHNNISLQGLFQSLPATEWMPTF